MISRYITVSILFLFFVGPTPCGTPSLQISSDNSALLGDLSSPEWQKRASAYDAIKVDPKALQRPAVKSALISLLDRENQLIHKIWTESKGNVGVSEKFGEEYSEYVADLQDTVAQIADWHDARQLCILASGTYNPDSPFASKLATKGGAEAVPCLLGLAHSNDVPYRENALAVLVEIGSDLPNSSALQHQIRQVTIGALHDPSVPIRYTTVQAVGRFGDIDMVPILEEIARSDPYSRPIFGGKQRFDIREVAVQSIAAIQGRHKGR